MNNNDKAPPSAKQPDPALGAGGQTGSSGEAGARHGSGVAPEGTNSAFIAIVGKPNVGKSSLLNNILKTKIAIVSPKPQTTRTRIMGVLTKKETQFVFIDTPGLHKPRTRLGDYMIRTISGAVSEVDACVLVVEPEGDVSPPEIELIDNFKKQSIPAILAVNKIDTIKNKEILLGRISEFSKLYDFIAVLPVSAKTGEGVDELLSELDQFKIRSPHFFDEDSLTDQPERVIASELIREKLLLRLDKEIPHGIAVYIESMKERESGDITDIDAVIFCERQNHKGIIIGKNGEMLKGAASAARRDMEAFFGCKINLKCWVRVKEDWRNRQGMLKSFGYNN